MLQLFFWSHGHPLPSLPRGRPQCLLGRSPFDCNSRLETSKRPLSDTASPSTALSPTPRGARPRPDGALLKDNNMSATGTRAAHHPRLSRPVEKQAFACTMCFSISFGFGFGREFLQSPFQFLVLHTDPTFMRSLETRPTAYQPSTTHQSSLHTVE